MAFLPGKPGLVGYPIIFQLSQQKKKKGKVQRSGAKSVGLLVF